MKNRLIDHLTNKVERLENENSRLLEQLKHKNGVIERYEKQVWRLQEQLGDALEDIRELEVLAELPDGGK